MKNLVFYWLLLTSLIFIGCQKELSFENGNIPAKGTLQSDGSGDCLPKTVNGVYLATTALVPANNTITARVNVTRTGIYVITTDTVNGYFFRATGVFTTLGNTDITLRGNGTPFSAGVNNFIVKFDSTVCDIAVTVMPAGTGPAVLTLNGSPGNCTGAVVNGVYATATALTATNTVAVNVMVTTPGTYNITTTYQGMTFASSGVFTTVGANTVTLVGSGTPTTAGVNVVPLTVGTNTCNFSVTVGSPSVGTLGGGPGACTPSTVSGVFTVGTATTASNTVQVQLNVTTAGSFNISTNIVAGFSFAGSGTITAGTSLITLIATGTPTIAGPQTFTLTYGTSTCTFTVNVLPAAGGAVGTLGGGPGACTPSTVNGTYTVGSVVTAANTVQVQLNATTAGTYTITSNTVTGLSFSGTGTAVAGTQLIVLNASGTPTTAGTQTFTITFGTSTCTFQVVVVPAATGAVGTLGGGPGACTPSTVNGTYTTGVVLGAANTVQVQINATTAGAYTIATNTVTGFSFSGTGTAVAGTQLIILNGAGTPTTAGAQTFTVTFGTSTCTFVVNVVPVSTDYFPRTTGSNWSYEFDDNVDPTDTLLRYATSFTHSALSNTYNIFMQTDGTPPIDSGGYYRKAGGDYFEWFNAGSFIGYDPPPVWAEYIFLKDNVPVGTSWISQGFAGVVAGPPPTPLNIRFKYAILQKDINVTITTTLGTVTYNNVIVVEEKFEREIAAGVWTDITSAVGSFKSYYARGIGLIKFEAFDGSGGPVYLQELRRYQVF